MARKSVTLVSSDGRIYSTSDPAEITRLKAHGYTVKPAKKQDSSSSPKSTST